KEFARGQAGDIAQSVVLQSDTKITAGDYGAVSGSDVVVITCGIPRGKDTEDRMELLEKNKAIIKGVAEKLKECAQGAVIVTVSNPSDVMNYLMQKTTGFPEEKVLGFGSILDSARFRHILSGYLKCNPSEIEGAHLIGEHGEAMVPLFSNIKVSGRAHDFSVKDKSEITEFLKKSAWNIIDLKGATEFGPASCIADTVGAILNNTKEIMPVSLVQDGASVGVLARVGKEGATPVGMKMGDDERQAFLMARKKLFGATNSFDK
ncbi:MAG: malate dehydrogenase, partial [Candidatus Aenigmarchaeota archaeon]|nr:malate dehydrogenase [Candidatus Aenigmarchaeota archaeon]